MNYDMDTANEYFENEEAKANMRADYREAIPRCKCGKPATWRQRKTQFAEFVPVCDRHKDPDAQPWQLLPISQ